MHSLQKSVRLRNISYVTSIFQQQDLAIFKHCCWFPLTLAVCRRWTDTTEPTVWTLTWRSVARSRWRWSGLVHGLVLQTWTYTVRRPDILADNSASGTCHCCSLNWWKFGRSSSLQHSRHADKPITELQFCAANADLRTAACTEQYSIHTAFSRGLCVR